MGHEFESHERKGIFDGTENPGTLVRIVLLVELLQLFFARNLHNVRPLIAEGNGNGSLLFAHLKFKIGDIDQSVALCIRSQIERIKRDFHPVQLSQSIGTSIRAASCHETNFVTTRTHVFEKFFDLQIWRTALVVKENGVINVKDNGFLLTRRKFIHLHANRLHCVTKSVVAFEDAHLFSSNAEKRTNEQMPTRQFVDDLYPKFGVKQ